MLFAAALIVSLAFPQDPTPQPAPTPTPKPQKPRKICRDDRATGTRMTSSTCLTAEEWAARDAAAQDTADYLRQRASSVSEPH